MALRCEDPKLIIRVINFELVQPISLQYPDVTDGQADGRTDGRLTIAIPRFALRASRGENRSICLFVVHQIHNKSNEWSLGLNDSMQLLHSIECTMILCYAWFPPFRCRSPVAVSPFCRRKIPLLCKNYVRKFRSVTAVTSKKIRNGSSNGNGVRKRQRLTGTAKRQRKNGNGMVETRHYPYNSSLSHTPALRCVGVDLFYNTRYFVFLSTVLMSGT